jgi:hypothetical protein
MLYPLSYGRMPPEAAERPVEDSRAGRAMPNRWRLDSAATTVEMFRHLVPEKLHCL